ncbi:hypothetical protein HEB94_002368 [Actinopolymorpha pittospori]|uniref:Uncharacterized protein n=1 Tax=Actinopolymorpha pittospori TaxID=648752 RepID=A0A927RAX9_9ACTN|nr:hypothetical protein [Actinopolymorpha pittospori]
MTTRSTADTIARFNEAFRRRDPGPWPPSSTTTA